MLPTFNATRWLCPHWPLSHPFPVPQRHARIPGAAAARGRTRGTGARSPSTWTHCHRGPADAQAARLLHSEQRGDRPPHPEGAGGGARGGDGRPRRVRRAATDGRSALAAARARREPPHRAVAPRARRPRGALARRRARPAHGHRRRLRGDDRVVLQEIRWEGNSQVGFAAWRASCATATSDSTTCGSSAPVTNVQGEGLRQGDVLVLHFASRRSPHRRPRAEAK